MNFKLDHIVIAVADLDRAVADHRHRGFTVQIGGRHQGRTSHNALVAFEDGAYLELIAWTAPAPSERRYNDLVRHGEGLVDFALLPEDVPRAIDEARSRGLALTGPLPGNRLRPDGAQIRWLAARQTTLDLPFLCGDVTPRELRVPAGAPRRHANGAIGVANLVVAVHELKTSIARYEALLGTPCGATIRLGETDIILTELRRPRGEGPCAFELRYDAATSAGTGGRTSR